MYRFLLRPRWIAGHLVVLALVVGMVNLGFWQLRRLDERRERNDRVESRRAAAPASLDDVLAGGVDAAEFRRVRVTGRFEPATEVLVRNRTFEGRPGFYVVTPLRTVEGDAVLVNRGWVPLSAGEEWPLGDAAAPTGSVNVVGFVRKSESKGRFGPSDPSDGPAERVNRIDVDVMDERVDGSLAPVYVQLASPEPGSDGLPAVVPLADLGEGPHLSYAVQWFTFSTIALVGWVILIRRSAREHAGEAVRAGPATASTA